MHLNRIVDFCVSLPIDWEEHLEFLITLKTQKQRCSTRKARKSTKMNLCPQDVSF